MLSLVLRDKNVLSYVMGMVLYRALIYIGLCLGGKHLNESRSNDKVVQFD